MDTELKQKIMQCVEQFALTVRMNLDYEDEQFDKLKGLLSDLAKEMRTATAIDKDLALNLYALPQIVRNMSLAYAGPTASRPDRFDRFEDAWMDLDALVTECLQPPVA
jgi:hypothetical protein